MRHAQRPALDTDLHEHIRDFGLAARLKKFLPEQVTIVVNFCVWQSFSLSWVVHCAPATDVTRDVQNYNSAQCSNAGAKRMNVSVRDAARTKTRRRVR